MTEGRKDDYDKPRWDLLPWAEVGQVVEILTFGAKKYEDNNWKRVQFAEPRYLAAAMRHLVAWIEGAEKDEESGKSHLAHAVCCLLFIMWFRNEPSRRKSNSISEMK